MPANTPPNTSSNGSPTTTASNGDRAPSRTCPVCWNPFTSPNPQRIYCGDRCRKTAYARQHAGPEPDTSIAPTAPAPVALRACPHCGGEVTIVALLTTPEAARPTLPSPGVIPLRRT